MDDFLTSLYRRYFKIENRIKALRGINAVDSEKSAQELRERIDREKERFDDMGLLISEYVEKLKDDI